LAEDQGRALASEKDAELYVIKPEEPRKTESQSEERAAEKPARFTQLNGAIAKAERIAKKPVVWGAAALAAAAILFVILSYFFDASKSPVYQPKPFRASEAIQASKDDRELIALHRSSSTLEGMLAKAALLYEEGSLAQALDVYEQVSLYSESLSLYNLGVARMKKADWRGAIEALDRQISNSDRKTPGAINAAVCALKLNDEPLFRRYVRIAKEELQNEVAAPLYGYYYTLVSYYDDRPFDALIGAATPSVDYLNEEQKLILAKMRLVFDDATGSIEALEKIGKPENAFMLGLLYARIGEWSKAADSLSRAISANVDVDKAKAALLLVHLKSGFFKDASSLIEEIDGANGDPFLYPIRAKLKDRLFDVAEAQAYFSERLLIDERIFLQALFAYAPYTLVDPDKGVTQIRKGQIALNEGEIDEAATFLEQGRIFSGAGARMSAAIKLALSNRLILANQALARAENDLKTSDSLEYNLALSYAQLGRFPEAYAHFRRAYYLNQRNIEAGVYSIVLSTFASANESRLVGELTAAFNDREDEQSYFWRALLSFHDRNYQATASWLEREKKDDVAQYILLDLFSADQTNRPEELKKAAAKLTKLYPNDLLSHIFLLYAENKGRSMRYFAFEAQKMTARRDLNFDSLFYGAPIARELYSQLALIAGALESTRELLAKRLAIEKNEPRALMQALVTIDIYRQNFEEAYALSNALIDELGVRDTETLLRGAIASIGAGHKENAIALLQMAKNGDPKNQEVRYALGLLYQEIGNAKSAALEYSQIGAGRYESRFFDFEIRRADDPERF
jgi:Tfp pilus assembly protein PilF